MSSQQYAGAAIQAGGSVASAIATGTAWAPIIGPAIAGVSLLVGKLLNRKGPRQKLQTSAWADEAERALVANLEAARNTPQLNAAEQAQALANFDAIWAELTRLCGDRSMGDPGRRCISERQRGGKWDWFALYRDPIAALPLASAAPPASSAAASSATGTGPTPALWPIVAFGLIALLVSTQ